MACRAQDDASEHLFGESFNFRVRDELLGGELFSCLTEAEVYVDWQILADWRDDFNRHLSHASRGLTGPAAFTHATQGARAPRPPTGDPG